MTFYFLLIILFLLGSIPTGLIISTLFYDCDPRTQGSGNIGMTNVWRILGPKAGIFTLFGDLGKGVLAILLMKTFSTIPIDLGIASVTVVLGHCYSAYLQFSGGKGIATAGGVILALKPLLFAVVFFIWVGVKLTTKISSLSALVSAVILVPLSYILLPEQIYTIIMLVMIITLRHKDNILRLRQGKE